MRPDRRSLESAGDNRRNLLLRSGALTLMLRGALGFGGGVERCILSIRVSKSIGLAGLAPTIGTTSTAAAQTSLPDRVFAGLAFSSVRYELPGRLLLRRASANRVTVRAERSVLDALRIRTEAGELHIAASGFETREPVNVLVEFSAMDRLTLLSSGDAELAGLRSDRLQVIAAGSGDFIAKDLNLSELTLDSSGSGTVHLAGQARGARFRLGGSGDLQAADLAAAQIALQSSGSGDAQVQATRALDVVLEGSGNVFCKGRPRIVRRGQGSGEVECGG